MAREIPNLLLSFTAGADLSSSYGLVGTINASGLLVVSTTAAAGGVGIIQDPVLAGRTSAVMAEGVSPAVYGATVTLGATPVKLTNNASGQLIPVSAATDVVVAIALESGSAGEQHSVLLK